MGEQRRGHCRVVAAAHYENGRGEMEEVRKDLLDGAVEDDVAIDVAVEAAAVVRLDPLGHAG